MVHALAVGQRLQFAMAVGHAHGADVIAFGEQQFERHSPVFAQPFAVGLHVHALADFGGAGGQQFANARDFHEAQAAGAHVIYPVQMTQRRDFDAGVGGDFQNGRALLGADLFFINR